MKSLQQATIGFIGAGNMAQAIIHGLVRAGIEPAQLAVANPSPNKLSLLQKSYPALSVSQDNSVIAQQAEIIILAVKPQMLAQALEPLVTLDLAGKLIISLAAGAELAAIKQLLKQPLAMVRAMPNTPATIGLGATGLYANELVSEQQLTQASTIFKAIGVAVWLEQEQQMDLVTAISGSGPAHYFYLLEAICQSAIKQGMKPETARLLASQTAIGAAEMVKQNPETALNELKNQVTSKGGTTAAALTSLENDNLATIMDKAIQASVARGQELARLAREES